MKPACAGLSWGPQTVDELVRGGFILKVPTYQQISKSKNRQCNNTYYVLDLPPLPREPAEESRVSEL